VQRKNISNDYELASGRLGEGCCSAQSRRPKLHLDLGIGSAIDADLKVVSTLTEKLYGDLRRNFFDGFLHFLCGTR
jgi:hypothetical protein